MMMTATTMMTTMMMTATTINSTAPAQLRHEQKHQISPHEDLVLTGRLCRLFPHDSHAGPDGCYRITSLYFDTPYDTALREKLDGVTRREKFRLRYYGTDISFIRLEKKYKVNGLCGKRSAPLTREQTEQLLNGQYSFLLQSENPLLLEFYSKLQGACLRPRSIVCYDREAFLYPPGNVRITLDRRVRTSSCCQDFLDPNLIYMNAFDSFTILEVKYDAFLPDLIRMAIQTPGRQASAFSKYAVCRRFD